MRRRNAAMVVAWAALCLLQPSAALGQFDIEPTGVVIHQGSSLGATVTYEFGLPCVPPEKQAFDGPEIPIANTTWLQDGIRYVQTVFLTRTAPGDLGSRTTPADDAVLLVRITGQNLAGEYTLAKAALSLSKDGKPLSLELRGQLLFAATDRGPLLAAALDIPSGALTRTNRDRIDFEGKMPPGTTGSLVVRIPVRQPHNEAEVSRLQDLDFDEEYQRVKKFWLARSRNRGAQEMPLQLRPPALLHGQAIEPNGERVTAP